MINLKTETDIKKVIKHCLGRFMELQKCLKDSENNITDKERIDYVLDFCNDMKKELKA